MASPFDLLDAAVSDVIVETMGETIHITPRTARQYVGPSADPARPAFDIVGVYTAAAIVDNLTGQRESNSLDTVTRMVSGRHEVFIAASSARSLAFDLVAGDLVTLVEETGAHPANIKFRIIGPPRREGAGDLRLILAPEDEPQ